MIFDYSFPLDLIYDNSLKIGIQTLSPKGILIYIFLIILGVLAV